MSARWILLTSLFLAAATAGAVVPLEAGRYSVVGRIGACRGADSAKVCAVVHEKTQSERWLELDPGEWAASIRSMKGHRLVLEGTWNGSVLKVESAPKVYRESVEHLLTNEHHLRKK